MRVRPWTRLVKMTRVDAYHICWSAILLYARSLSGEVVGCWKKRQHDRKP